MLLQLSSDQVEQIENVLKSAQMNNWQPLGIILGLCVIAIGLLTILLIYIWKSTKTITENRLSEHSEMMTMLSKNSNEHSLIIKRLETMSEVHDRDIKDLKSA